MKKKILGLTIILCGLFINVFAQNKSDNLIGDFLNSPEFGRVSRSYNDLGEIDFGKSTVVYIDNDRLKPEINIFFIKNKAVSAVIKAIPLKESHTNVLPANERYIMCLIDYRNYTAGTNSGEIKTVDLNYDNYVFGTIYLNNSKLINLIVTDLPESILSKYSGLVKKSDLGSGIAAGPHHCDLNQNGNVTYSECFTCMLRACLNNQQCALLCGLTNMAGGAIGSLAGTCTASIATSCVFISIWY